MSNEEWENIKKQNKENESGDSDNETDWGKATVEALKRAKLDEN